MGSPNFRFKQFTVWHDRCAMKVGTDGVLLGAWSELPKAGVLISLRSNDYSLANVQEFRGSGVTTEQAQSAAEHLNSSVAVSEYHYKAKVLDVGTGSGLIALMLAQRFEGAEIIAIDIDPGAVEQARYNFGQSPWSNRLACQQTALQDLEGQALYDLIVSNPPYFQDSLKNPDSQRALARHTDTLSYQELMAHSARLLKEGGRLALVLPIEAEQQIIALAQAHKLYPTHITHVFPKPGKAAKRILIAMQKIKTNCQYSTLTLESETSPRSEEYQELTKEFYL